MTNKKLIWMATEVSEDTAIKFDKIASKNLRSRAKHMEFIIIQEVKKQGGSK